MKASDVLEQVEQAAQAKAKPDPVRYGSMAVGDFHRQGDVYLRRHNLKTMRGLSRVEKPDLQLAPGDTQGSRHCLDSLDGITLYSRPDATALDGPLIVAEREFTVLHPEHGNVTLPAGQYSIHYQRQYAEELRRVAD